MWELEYKSWVQKNWCFWIVLLEKTLESPLDCKEIQPIHPKGNQSWVFIGRTDVEAETPMFWPPDAKTQLIRKDPDTGKDWRQEEKGMTENEMVGWHHWLNGLSLSNLQEIARDREGKPGVLQFTGSQSQTWLSDWTATTIPTEFQQSQQQFLAKKTLLFSPSVMYNSLQPHALQQARTPCPSPTPRAYSNSCPLSQWCHPTISSSVIPFSSCLQSFPVSGSFQMS